MRQSVRWLIFVGVAASLSLVLSGVEARKPGKPAPAPAINKLRWLAGSWRMEKLGRVIDEQWMAPAAGVMLGMSRTVAKGRVVEQEFLQIREGPGGDLFYVMQPAGHKEAAFQLKSLADTGVVFENLQENFPQRITYTLKPDGSVLAVREGPGPEEGEVKRVEYAYQKIQ